MSPGREIRIGAGVQALVAVVVVLIGGVVGTLTWLDGRYVRSWQLDAVAARLDEEKVERKELQTALRALAPRVEVLLDRLERRPPGGPAQAAPPAPEKPAAPDDVERLTREVRELVRRLDQLERDQREHREYGPSESRR